MKVTTKEVRNVTAVLDEIVKAYKETKEETKRDWRTYEQRLEFRIKTGMRELEPLVDEAISTLDTVKADSRGRKPELSLKQKTLLLLLKHLFIKSNRNMSFMLMTFSLLSDIDTSYKTVERLYSDQEVLSVLHNLHLLLLKKKGVQKADCSGDGTGYSLSIREHYGTVAEKRKDKAKKASKKKSKRAFLYAFVLADLDTGMHIGCGTSFKSEKEAYNKAVDMAKERGINLEGIRLDKYYSGQGTVKQLEELFPGTKIWLIPKTNATVKGPWKWKRMLHSFVQNTHGFLEEYFKRNRSESIFSEDKRRFGWQIAQRREDRADTAIFCTTIWHCLFWLR